MYDNSENICTECGEEVEDFMIETYEIFIEQEEDQEVLCSECLHNVTGGEDGDNEGREETRSNG